MKTPVYSTKGVLASPINEKLYGGTLIKFLALRLRLAEDMF
jgi:hypothetical protein